MRPSYFHSWKLDPNIIAAKILSQIQNGGIVPVEIFAQAKAKEPPNDALPKFFAAYSSHQRVGALLKDAQSGKLVTEWDKLVKEAGSAPEVVDISPAVSTFLAVKDDEELVRN